MKFVRIKEYLLAHLVLICLFGSLSVYGQSCEESYVPVIDFRLDGTSWQGIKFGLITAKNPVSVESFKDSCLFYDVELRFINDEYLEGTIKTGLHTESYIKLNKTTDSEYLQGWKNFTRSLDRYMRMLVTENIYFIKLEENNKLLITQQFEFNYTVDDDCLVLEVPRIQKKFIYVDNNKKKRTYKPTNGGGIEGLWDNNKVKNYFIEKSSFSPSNDSLNRWHGNDGFITYIINGTAKETKLVYWVDSRYLYIASLSAEIAIILPYEISKDGKSLQIKLKKDKNFIAKKRTELDALQMRTMEDSLLLMSNYERFKSDSLLNSTTIQQNKEDFLRIVNGEYRNRVYGDSIELNLFPDSEIVGEVAEIAEDSSSLKDSYFITISEDGELNKRKLDSYKELALKYTDGIVSTDSKESHRYSRNRKRQHFCGDVIILALNNAFDEQKSSLMEQFVNETKQCFINNVLPKYDAVSTHADSVSFACGFFAGEKLAADSIYKLPGVYKDCYEFLDGVSSGYESNKNDRRLGFLILMGYISSKARNATNDFMIAMNCGVSGAEAKHEPAYVAGAYYGFSGAKCSWSRKDLEKYSNQK